MTAKFLRYKLGKIAIAITVLAITTLSCTDDLAYRQDADGPSGEKAVISLSFEVREPNRLTRADIDEYDAKRVKTIWVGIYNASTGDNTANVYITSGQHGFTAGTNNHVKSILTGIPTKSGKSYIVAVANPDQYVGITTGDDPDNENAKKSLTELLADAKSWDAYKSIIVTGVAGQNNSVDIQTPAINGNQGLLMSGIYTEKAHDNHSSSHPDISETAYYIPAGENTLTGAIHLRRLISHINFNIQASGTIVEITPQSYQVHNVPFASWLHERVEDNPSSDNRIGYANAGDALEPNYANNKLYRNSLVFTSTSFDKEVENNITSYSFDFWMMENKREGIQNFRDGMTENERYATREQEYGVDGKYYPTAQSGTVKSSGIFVSLSGFDNPTLNNRAAYVDIPCVVKYKSVTSEENGIPGSSNPGVTDNEGLLNPGAVRTANITYRIHLGYINKDAKDFNSYRNSDYTYNVKISDLHSVIVEVFREKDPQPGGFGDVTDVSDKFFELDAHYGVFNIFLDKEDLSTFSYRMVCYENNQPHEIIGGSKEVDNPDTQITEANEKYYNWVRLVYTGNTTENETYEAKLAPYPGIYGADLLYLNDLLPNNSRVAPSPGWYTVYINEHVYETSADETGGNWKSYVNQPDRMLWINVAQKISADGSSVFYKAKYAAAQRSIQTYYNTTGDNVSAIGVEHENENFGMNIRWTNAVSIYGLNADNGRWNVWSKLEDTQKDRRWDNFISLNVLQKVNPITNNKLPSTVTPSQKKGGLRYVPMINTLTGLNSNMGDHPNYANAATASATDYDPQNSGDIQYIQAMYACMNRNRDENGNGTIEASELKWYLPASGKYLRVILGRNSLSTPILNYVNNEVLPYKTKAQDAFFLLVSSDNKVIWAVEGMSSSPFVGTSYCAPPWQVRCIRNLGTNLNKEIANSEDDGVDPAYSKDVSGTSAIVRVQHYYGTSLRNPTTTPLPVHKTNSEYNRLARYGFEVAYIGNNSAEPNNKTEEEKIPEYARSSAANFMNYLEGDLAITGWDTSVTHYIPCETLNNGTKKGWRVPNQKELTIMLRLKILKSRWDNEFFTSCTTEYWDNGGSSSTALNLNNYRLAAARVWDNGMTQESYNGMQLIRCVRDLQPGE